MSARGRRRQEGIAPTARGRRRRGGVALSARGRRGQGGVALITVLAVIAFTMVVVGALFGLLGTTMQVTTATEEMAREARAADAAVETAINQMRLDACDPSAQPFLGTQVFDQGTATSSDDVSVEVTCRSVAGSSAVSDQVRIVGSAGYQGALRWGTDCAADPAATGCLAWSSALGSVPSGLASSGVSLVHGGHEPLQFASGVSVRTGAAALRNPTAPTAMVVSGDYAQGAPGIGATPSEPCGMLAGDPGNGAGLIEDVDRSPICDDEGMRALQGDPTSNVSGLIAPVGPPPTPVPTTCSTPVVSFAPGTYNALATAAVSQLTDGSIAACRNRTFHFTPGVYAFEGAELVFGDAGSYYVFGAPSGWSAPAGVSASPVAADPGAALCDPTASGTSLVINGWTEIDHRAGRVAICPARPDTGGGEVLDAHPAIYQQTAVPTGVEVVSVNRAIPGNPITLPFSCRAPLFGSYPTTRDIDQWGFCRPQRRYEVRLATDGQAPVTSLRVLLTGQESTSSPNSLIRNRRSRFFVFDGANQLRCQTNFVTGVPNGRLTSSFDLRALPGSCSTATLNQSQLDGGRIVIDHMMEITAPLLGVSQGLSVPDDGIEVEVNAVSGLASEVRPTSSWNAAGNVRTPGPPVATPVMSNGCTALVCAYPDPGRSIVNVADHTFVHEMTLTDFDFPGLFASSNPDLDPSIRTLRALVKVVPSNATLPAGWPQALRDLLDSENFLIPVEPELELRTPSGGRCIVQSGGINSDQEISFDLLDPNLENPAAPNCNNVVYEHASELSDASLTLRFRTRCVPNWFNGFPSQCLRGVGFYDPTDTSPIWQLRPPDIEHVRLTTVTDTYSGPPPNSRVTLDATTAAAGSSFNVYGRTWMPLTDLDLHWNGGVTSAPVFGADLVLHGLGSTMAPGASMGVVCCSPPDSRTVDLVATIDGVERLAVRVDFTDVAIGADGTPTYSPGAGVDVLEYRRCGRRGCATPVAPPGGAVPPAVEDPP